MAVLAHHPNARSSLLRGVEKRRAGVIQLARQARHIGGFDPEALRIVVQVRQIDQCQLWMLRAQNFGGAVGNPLRGGQARHWAPERVERKWPEFCFETLGQSGRGAGVTEQLVAMRAVPRVLSYTYIDVCALVEPPEKFGAAKGLAALGGPATRGPVERFGLKKTIGLLPKTHLARVAEQPAIGHDAVPVGKLASEHRRLGGAG